MKSQIWWYTARAGGIVAWALLTVSVVWGLLLSSRVLGRRISGPKLLDLHRFIGGLAVSFTAVHLAGLVLDETVHFGVSELLVPFASTYEPGAVAWGIVGFYALVAVEITSLARRRIGERVWRLVHYAAFAAFAFGTVHALALPGTDVDNPLIWWPAAAASAAVVGLVIARLVVNGDPVPAAPPVSPLEAEVEARERMIVEQVRTERDRPEAALIERTLLGLRALDDVPQRPAPDLAVPPAHGAERRGPVGLFDFSDPAAATVVPQLEDPAAAFAPPIVEPFAHPPFAPPVVPLFDEAPSDLPPFPPPAPLAPSQVTSGSLFPSSADMVSSPGPLDLTVPADLASGASTAPTGPSPFEATPPAAPFEAIAPIARRAPVDGGRSAPLPTRLAQDLPVRTPRRLARTTTAAERLDAWKPNRAALPAVLPPEPPTAVDPVTGEPDPVAYRQWLKEWLAYVESQA